MITLGQEQHLGRKAFLLLLARRTTIGWISIIVFLALVLFQKAIGVNLSLVLHGVGLGASLNEQIFIGGLNYVILVVLLGSITAFLIGYIVAVIEYRNYTFTLDEFDLRMNRGILNKKILSVPYRQIQDLNIERTILMRILGLSSLVIQSAGHEDNVEHGMSEVILQPIEKDIAEDVLVQLQREIGVQVVEQEKVADQEFNDAQKGVADDGQIPLSQ